MESVAVSSRVRVRALAVVTALISYGSIYPFDFRAPADALLAFRQLIGDHHLWTSRGDVLGNFGLFVPFGLAGVYAIEAASARRRAVASTLVTGVILALALQVLQIWIPSRSAALADVFWNGVGVIGGIGLGLGLATSRLSRDLQLDSVRLSALTLVAIWLLSQLAPLVPALDFHGIKRSLRPLLIEHRFDLVAAIYLATQVNLVSCLLSRLVRARHALALTAVLLAMVLVGKIFIVEQSLTVTVVAGCLTGLGAHLVMGRYRSTTRASMTVLVLLVGAYGLQALAPFQVGQPSTFSWLPFASTLDGTMLANVRSLSTAAFVLGGAMWLTIELGWPVARSAVGLSLYSLALELAQLWIPGRTASSTEPALALLAGWILFAVGVGRRGSEQGSGESEERPGPDERGI